jgi:hypothetical protein
MSSGIFEDLVGRRYGNLVVVKRAPNRTVGGFSQVRWRCRCDCGGTTTLQTARLTTGNTKSCGCLKDLSGSLSKFWSGCGDLPGSYWCQVRNSAKRRSLAFRVTIEEAWKKYQKQKGLCALSGEPISFTKNSTASRADTTASLDRVDSSKGYIRGNIQWVHKRIQGMKSNMPQDEFLMWCHKIARKRRSR